MISRRWPLLVLPLTLVLAACAPTEQQRADDAAVMNSGVSPAIYDKMLHEDDLSISDIVALSQAHVNDGIIIRYIRDQDTTYIIGRRDIQYMQNNGVSQSVIDFMVQTNQGGGPFFGPPISVGIGVGGGWR
jgi:hypothetical protein